MVLGHYAAAYIARPHARQAPFWLLLLCSNLAEFLWLVLALAGVEATQPPSILDATFANLEVHMTYSHNLLPNLALGLIVGIVVWAIYRDRNLALWCSGLTVLHVWSDYIVGFQHEVLGPHSMKIGLNSYGRFPHGAILIEWAFAMACLYYYRTKMRSQVGHAVDKKTAILAIAFSIGILAWLPSATIPMRAMLPF
ncbi:MAG: hypothetical protein KDK37_10840 [Leptospiraceae bacterium]|nr:hypothetical protein [Leptospiraceae bacterium]MCB1304768.1 hypothetical protein [Leptospiraceae bacterium]